MSQVTPNQQAVAEETHFVPPAYSEKHVRRQMDELLSQVQERIAPVWPLKDYVAVNPFAGVSERSFMDARSFLRVFSDCETLMPLSYYVEAFQRSEFGLHDVQSAVNELTEQFHWSEDTINTSELVETLKNGVSDSVQAKQKATRQIRTLAELVGDADSVNLQEAIQDEISKHCAAHYDEGQALWKNPHRHLPLYQSWKQVAQYDQNIEWLGLTGFRGLVTKLPETPDAAILAMLGELQVPESLWVPFLLCQAYSIPGWSAWAKYQSSWTDDSLKEQDFIGLLAIRLAYDVAAASVFKVSYDWGSIAHGAAATFKPDLEDDSLIRFVLLRASELAVRDQMLFSMKHAIAATKNDALSQAKTKRKLAQMVFCIDVRSERIRQQLEIASEEVETFGFAGFFGMPIETVPLGSSSGDASLPVLLKPQFSVHETISDKAIRIKSVVDRINVRSWRKTWKSLQSSAIGCFPFVETAGLLSGWKLLSKSFGSKSLNLKHDGVAKEHQCDVGPDLSTLEAQGVDFDQQLDLAESMLRNLGLVQQFARLVVLCGHSSETANNPLAAGLDCGACGGHSGEPNAKFAALLLNQGDIRKGLSGRGIEIPFDTVFMAGLHNTTTDTITLFGTENIPHSHAGDVEELQELSRVAGDHSRKERLQSKFQSDAEAAIQKAADWSEVRPEWGLAGNAAFIVGPRELTKSSELGGRAFLHSYNHHLDSEYKVLETIMTAPMVVAHWINMQYYASTVDNKNYGSGTKTVHNVVGQFGILSGNGGDLMTGLPWQSLHDGEKFQHHPVRLQSVIAAPRDAIKSIIDKHELLGNLLSNGWMNLTAIEDGNVYHYQPSGEWEQSD